MTNLDHIFYHSLPFAGITNCDNDQECLGENRECYRNKTMLYGVCVCRDGFRQAVGNKIKCLQISKLLSGLTKPAKIRCKIIYPSKFCLVSIWLMDFLFQLQEKMNVIRTLIVMKLLCVNILKYMMFATLRIMNFGNHTANMAVPTVHWEAGKYA